MNAPDNIERAIERLHVATTAALDERIFRDAAVAFERDAVTSSAPVRLRLWRALAGNRVVRVAAAVALTVAVLAAAVVLYRGAVREAPVVVQGPTEPVGPNVPGESPQSQRALAAERQGIEAMYAAGDIDALVRVLGEAQFENKIVAAGYLGEIGDERAVAALSQLAAEWSGDPADNPFARATAQIKGRTQGAEPNVPDLEPEPQGRAVPEAKPAPVLSGTITDIDTGTPLEGVQVQISPSGGGRVSRVTTDSNGVYAFERVGADGAYNILLNAPEHVTPADWERPRETIQLSAGGHVVRDFALARGAKLAVTVRNEQGRPVERANLYASYVSDEMGRGPKRPVRSDAKGQAALGGLRPDEYLVTVAHPDYALAGRTVVLDEAGQIRSIVVELRKGIDVVGVATCSDDLPAGGWEIRANPQWWHSTYSWPYDDPVAEDGTFILKHILPGLHRLGVYIPTDGGSQGIWSTDVNLPPETGLLEVKIPRPSPYGRVSISGTVAFAGDEYEGGFWIHGRSAAGHFGSTYVNRGERDFTLADLVPGLYDLDITLLGKRNEFKSIKAPSEGVVLEVSVGKKLRLRARVVDKRTGRPVTDFELREAGEREYRRVSDPNGGFEIESYGPECRVHIRAEGYGEKMSDNLYRDVNELAVIELGAPAALAGIVVDATGRPIEGATVSHRYRRSREEPPEGKYITSTGADGRFTAEDIPADSTYHWFVFRHPDYARDMRYVKVSQDGVTEVKIVLEQGGTVEGRLYDWQGTPLGNTPLYFMDESHFAYWKENRARLGTVTTNPDGFYRMEHLPEELCYVFRDDAHKQLGVILTSILPRAGEALRLDIGGPWKVTGRLLKAGEPVANTHLMVYYEAGTAQGFAAHTLTNALGQFAFYGLPTGQRRIYWGGEGSYSWAQGWTTLGTFAFEAGLDQDLGDWEVTVAQVTVALTVEDPAVPLDSWSVVIQEYDADGFWGRRVGQFAPRRDHTDPYVFSGVPDGRYEVIAQRQGYPSVRKVFEIEPGHRSEAVAVMLPSGSCTLSGKLEPVMSEQAQPRLMLRSADQRITAEIQVSPDGTFEVQNLPPGEYAIGRAFVGMSRSSTLARVHLDPGEHKMVSIEASPDDPGYRSDAYLVVLLVTDRGLPLATPDVWLERAGQVIKPHFNTDDGKSFTGAPGTYVLHAEYPGFRTVETQVEMKSKQDRTMQDILKPVVITMSKQ